MPGFPPICLEYFDCSFDVWVTMAAMLAYALIAETALLMLSMLIVRLRRMPGSGIAAPLVVALCALIAAACVGWLLHIAPQMFIAPFIHYTPALAAQMRRVADNKLTQMFVPIGVNAAAFVLGTALTAATLILHALAGRRGPSTSQHPA